MPRKDFLFGLGGFAVAFAVASLVIIAVNMDQSRLLGGEIINADATIDL
jgi:hypothetical protein